MLSKWTLSVITAVILASVTCAVEIETVPVGNPGNPDDTTGYGGVGYEYWMGTYEVTAGQYCEFLNAVAKKDTFNLWSPLMWDSKHGCKIERIGEEGSYAYSVAPDRADRPVNYVSWRDAVRFANWMHNGQPIGSQDLTTTEDGAYFLNGITSRQDLMEVTREPDAVWFVPSEDEWYKAAYHKNDGVTGNYWRYPTGTNLSPSNDLIDPDPGNTANYWQGGYTLGEPYYTTEVGEFENSESPYGTFDQAGNVWEWNEGTLYEGRFRGWRGGYWSYHLSAGSLVSAWSRNGSDPWAEKADSGFRLATIPEPGGLILIASGLSAILACRRRKLPPAE